MSKKEKFEFHEEWLSLKKYDFRLLSMITILADNNRAFRGTLSELCKELDIQSSSANKNTMIKNLNNLAAANIVNIIVDKDIYTISLAKAAEKSKNIITIKKAWYLLIRNTPTDTSWDSVLKVFLKLSTFAPASLHTEKEISKELNMSVSTVKRAISTLKKIDFVDFYFKIDTVKEKLPNGRYRTNGNLYSAALDFSK